MRIDRGLVGCLGALYLMAIFFLAAAWLGPFWGFGNWHGLGILLSPDLVRTTGRVIRTDSVSIISNQSSTPIVEYSIGSRRIIFHGEGSNLHGLHPGDEVAIVYRRSDPQVAYIRSFDQQFGVPMVMIVLALPFLALAIWGTYSNLPGVSARREQRT